MSDFAYGPAFDAVDIGVIVLDEQRRIAGWNEWIARVSGRTKESVWGERLLEVFPTLQATRLPGVIEDCFQFGTSSILTYSLNKLLPLKGEGGQELLHNVIVRAVASEAGRFCLLQINDVSVSVARERVLRERQNARYHAIVDSAPDAIVTTSLDGMIQWANGAAEHIFGYPLAELLGRPIDALLAEPGGLGRAFGVGDSDGDGASIIQVIGRRREGHAGDRPAHFAVSFARWEADDRVFVTTIWRDVSEIVDARNAQLRINEELEARVAERTREREIALGQLHESQKMEAIGQLTGGVAHDFNNLLAVILGSLALLKKTIPDDPRTSRLLEGAIQGAERGATLTKRLLAFARRQELKLEAVEIQKLVPELLDFLRQSVGPSVTIVADIQPDILPVRIDATQLELALMNLAVNARDAMPKGGRVTISGCNETWRRGPDVPASLAPGDYVRLSVADTGIGMSDATLAKALEPFFTTKGIGKGTGLGLPMVHGLTAQAGGAMHIRSTLGKGTVVDLWLPRASEQDRPQAPIAVRKAAAEAGRQNLRILLVDDDALVSMGTADMLMDLGHSVLEASSAARALQLLSSDAHFDIVVTDYAMPNMNGFDLATRIRQMIPRLPIILATGYAELPPHAAPMSFPRLEKPYTQHQLATALETALRHAQN